MAQKRLNPLAKSHPSLKSTCITRVHVGVLTSLVYALESDQHSDGLFISCANLINQLSLKICLPRSNSEPHHHPKQPFTHLTFDLLHVNIRHSESKFTTNITMLLWSNQYNPLFWQLIQRTWKMKSKCRCGEQISRHRWEREGGINWEIRFDIKAPSCIKQTASWKMLYSTGSPAWGSVVT